MYILLIGKIGGRSQLHCNVQIINGKLAFQQFQKKRCYALGGIDLLLFQRLGGLDFQSEVQEFKNLVSNRVILVFVIRIELFCDSLKYFAHNSSFFIGKFKDMHPIGLEDFILAQLPKLMEEVLVENTVHAFP